MAAPSRFVNRSILLNGLFAVEGASMFIMDMALAATLGLGSQSDILYAAWSLPQTIGRGMFQSLTNSFMGMFSQEDNTTIPFRQAITVITVLSVSVAAIMSLTARWWLPLSMLGAESQTWREGILPATVLAWLIALLGPAETFRAVYYRADRLFIPSGGRILGVLTTIAIILFTRGEGGLLPVAWGVVIGAAVETLIGFVGFRWFLNFRYRFAWPDLTTLREMIRIVGLPLAGQGVRVIFGVLERAMASYLGPGALTAVSFATRLITTLDRFVFRGFLVATIQTFTAKEKPDYNSRLRLIALLALPIALVFALLSPQLINVAFGRGRFTADDVQIVSLTTRAYGPAIIGLAMTSVPLGLAYARRQSSTVLGFFFITSVIQIALIYFSLQAGFHLPVFGIALTIATFISLFWLSRRAGYGFHLWSWRDTAIFLGLAAFVAMGTLAVRAVSLPGLSGQMGTWVQLIIGGTTALATTILGAWLLRIPEVAQIMRFIRPTREPAGE